MAGDPPCWTHLFEERNDLTGDAILAGLVRELTDAVIIADSGGTIVFCNEAAQRLFGWSVEEAVGQTLDLIGPERLRDRHWTGYHRVMANGDTEYGTKLLEVPTLHREGQKLSISFMVTLLHDPDGSVGGIAADLRDETARWQERRARQTELADLRAKTEI